GGGHRLVQLARAAVDDRQADSQAVARRGEPRRLEVAVPRTGDRVGRLPLLQLARAQLGLRRHERAHAAQRLRRARDRLAPPPARPRGDGHDGM
ncbi:MAG: hypothetical protein AVDCRST_MAG64-242, partial [uncultured Phycisphaerae bacterium]